MREQRTININEGKNKFYDRKKATIKNTTGTAIDMHVALRAISAISLLQ
jgi:hypothetical protein